MKALQCTFLLLICFGFCDFAFAQEKPVALKFDEFNVIPEKDTSSFDIISVRLERFARELKKQPQTKAVIIGYDPRKQFYNNTYWTGDNRILTLQRELETNGIAEKRIIRVVGGIRENESFELWFLPKDAQLPRPHPEYEKSDIVYCPAWIQIKGIDYAFDRSNPLEFSAEIYKENPSQELVYEWEISAGKIIEGQGAIKIKINANGTEENNLFVKLNVKGLALECKNQAVRNIAFVKYPYKFAEFPKYGENLKWYPHSLFTELYNHPELEGKIFVYGARNMGMRSIILGIADLKNMFRFMRFPIDKVPIEMGGYREELTFEMWLYPKGSESPKPTPTVDEKFVVIKRKTPRRR